MDLILFLLIHKFCLVYFHIYLKKSEQIFVLFLNCVLIQIFSKNRILKGRWKLSKVHPTYILLEGKHSEPWHNFCCVLFDANTTPPWHEVFVILCDDMIILMSAWWRFLAVGNWYACDSNHPRLSLMPTGRNPGKSLSWVDTSLLLIFRWDEYSQ